MNSDEKPKVSERLYYFSCSGLLLLGAGRSISSPTTGTLQPDDLRFQALALVLLALYISVFTIYRSASSQWRKRWDIVLQVLVAISTPVMGFLILELGLFWAIGREDPDPTRRTLGLGTFSFVLVAIAILASIRAHYRWYQDRSVQNRLESLEKDVGSWQSLERESVHQLTQRVLALSQDLRRHKH
jgi:hypothetical protein